jgi:hypothetical protein
MCSYAGALYVPPTAPAPDLHSNPQDRHVQANESNSPADETTPEPCEVYQVGLYLMWKALCHVCLSHQPDARCPKSIKTRSTTYVIVNSQGEQAPCLL